MPWRPPATGSRTSAGSDKTIEKLELRSSIGLSALPGYIMNSSRGLAFRIFQRADCHISTRANRERIHAGTERRNISRRISSGIVILLLLCAGRNVAAADWPTFGGNAERSGSVEDSLLSPAKAAGNMAVTLLVFSIWSLVKIIRMGGWHVFSVTFVVGTPLLGLALVLGLLISYAKGMAEFNAQVLKPAFLSKEGSPSPAAGNGPPSIT